MPEIALIALIVLLPIDHDGKRYAPGARLEVTEDQAKPLIDTGAAELAPADDAQSDADNGGSASTAKTTASAKKR